MEKSDTFALYKRFSNFFPLIIQAGTLYFAETDSDETILFKGVMYSFKGTNPLMEPPHELVKNFIASEFIRKLSQHNYSVNDQKYVAYDRVNGAITNPAFDDLLLLFDGFEFRFYSVNEQLFFVCDPHLIIKSKTTVADLVSRGISLSSLHGVSVIDYHTTRKIGYMVSASKSDPSSCIIQRFDRSSVEEVNNASLSIEPRVEVFQSIMKSLNRNFDLETLRRNLTFLASKTASRDRLLKTLEIVKHLNQRIFPLKFGDFSVEMQVDPAVVQV